MTDNEIIKALEHCSVNFNCHGCYYIIFGTSCRDELNRKALDLINRQKAEIERLGKSILKEKLRNNMLYEVGNEIKSVAIKDFAEKLKEKCNNYYPSIDSYCVSRKAVEIVDIDNLVKEITEVQNNDRV